MSHYLTIVACPPGSVDPNDPADVATIVDKLLEPYDEDAGRTTWIPEPDFEEGGYWTNPSAFWDWYQIGGRWTGLLDGYDPDTDPNLLETCTTCHGTGMRDWTGCNVSQEWIIESGGCNGCAGKGVRQAWPTGFPVRCGDWGRLGDVRPKLIERSPYFLVAGEGYVEQDAVADELATLSDDCLVVVVDVHN